MAMDRRLYSAYRTVAYKSHGKKFIGENLTFSFRPNTPERRDLCYNSRIVIEKRTQMNVFYGWWRWVPPSKIQPPPFHPPFASSRYNVNVLIFPNSNSETVNHLCLCVFWYLFFTEYKTRTTGKLNF